jgi:hypothetical protein
LVTGKYHSPEALKCNLFSTMRRQLRALDCPTFVAEGTVPTSLPPPTGKI